MGVHPFDLLVQGLEDGSEGLQGLSYGREVCAVEGADLSYKAAKGLKD